jgi:hypothetical protein
LTIAANKGRYNRENPKSENGNPKEKLRKPEGNDKIKNRIAALELSVIRILAYSVDATELNGLGRNAAMQPHMLGMVASST